MPKKGHSEEQIITALNQYESGEKVADICRKLGVARLRSTRGRCLRTGSTISERHAFGREQRP